MKVLRMLGWVLLWVIAPLRAEEPAVIYLTWIKDPASTMTVVWHTEEEESKTALSFHPQKGDWKRLEGQSNVVSRTNVRVHIVNIEGLKDDSVYVFKIEGSRREYHFRTMPKKLSRPIIVAVGGDAYQGKNVEMFRRMNRMVAYNDPDFIVMGGDLAYTIGSKHFFKGRKWEITRWQMFFLELQKTMMGKDGRLIPLLPVVGNHDVRKTRPQKSEMFYELFPFPVPMTAYRAVDFGDYLSWVLLDTGHTSPIEGVQTEWLERTLEERKDSPYLFTAYHIAAYPSYYPYDGKVPEKLRSNWVPLFEQYQVPAAFEHHNHTYKQTHPLKGGKVDPAGITYFGDGVWSVSPRQPQPPSKLWYLLKSESINMCYILTLTSEKCTIEAKNYQGNVIDQFISPVRQPAAASR